MYGDRVSERLLNIEGGKENQGFRWRFCENCIVFVSEWSLGRAVYQWNDIVWE